MLGFGSARVGVGHAEAAGAVVEGKDEDEDDISAYATGMALGFGTESCCTGTTEGIAATVEVAEEDVWIEEEEVDVWEVDEGAWDDDEDGRGEEAATGDGAEAEDGTGTRYHHCLVVSSVLVPVKLPLPTLHAYDTAAASTPPSVCAFHCKPVSMRAREPTGHSLEPTGTCCSLPRDGAGSHQGWVLAATANGQIPIRDSRKIAILTWIASGAPPGMAYTLVTDPWRANESVLPDLTLVK